jgi:superoxide dismutase, Fe-Mn family
MHRRKFIKTSTQATAALALGTGMLQTLASCTTTSETTAGKTTTMATPVFKDIYGVSFEQAALPYAYNAFTNAIDETTMNIHHTKHAATYLKNVKDELTKLEANNKKPLVQMLGDIKNYSPLMRNNLGGHFNHELFWKCLTPNSAQQPTGALAIAMQKHFTSFDNFKTLFTDAAKTRFGSGWAWLIFNPMHKNQLQITSTPNQDNTLMNIDGIASGYPLLGLDVWEHAYYLKYQNKRADYVNAFWSIVNWDYVDSLYKQVY